MSGIYFIHTLDMLKVESEFKLRIINLTNEFNESHGISSPTADDMFVEMTFDIKEKNMDKF